MDRKYVEEYFNKNGVVKVNLMNGRFYEGRIIDVADDSFMLKDKVGHIVAISYESVSVIVSKRGVESAESRRYD